MRIFVAGASGAIGKRLVPLLVENGHAVVGTTRSPEKVESLRAGGAEPAVVDLLDPEAVTAAVRSARPEVVVHEATALAATSLTNMRKFDDEFAPTNRLRIEGTDHLLAAARTAGAVCTGRAPRSAPARVTSTSIRSASAASRSSAAAAVSGRSSTSMMPSAQPWPRSNAARAASTTSLMTNPPRFRSGCRRSRWPSARSRPAGSPPGWAAFSPVRQRSRS